MRSYTGTRYCGSPVGIVYGAVVIGGTAIDVSGDDGAVVSVTV